MNNFSATRKTLNYIGLSGLGLFLIFATLRGCGLFHSCDEARFELKEAEQKFAQSKERVDYIYVVERENAVERLCK